MKGMDGVARGKIYTTTRIAYGRLRGRYIRVVVIVGLDC